MYGKIHQSLYTGSLLGSGPDVFAVWGWVIAHVVDGVVEINPTLLAMVIGKITADEVCEVLKLLGGPDKNSRTQAEDGRRLVPVNEEAEILPGRAVAYRVVNHALYRDFKTPVERREYMRNYMRTKRAKTSVDVNSVNSVNPSTVKVKHTEAYTETEAEADSRKCARKAEISETEMPSTNLGPLPVPVPIEIERATVAAFSAWRIAEDPKAKPIDPMTNEDYPIRQMLSRLEPDQRAEAAKAADWCRREAKPFKNVGYAVRVTETTVVEGKINAPRSNGRPPSTAPRRPSVTKLQINGQI